MNVRLLRPPMARFTTLTFERSKNCRQRLAPPPLPVAPVRFAVAHRGVAHEEQRRQSEDLAVGSLAGRVGEAERCLGWRGRSPREGRRTKRRRHAAPECHQAARPPRRGRRREAAALRWRSSRRCRAASRCARGGGRVRRPAKCRTCSVRDRPSRSPAVRAWHPPTYRRPCRRCGYAESVTSSTG